MYKYTTNPWGYKIVSDNAISFYHSVLPKIELTKVHTILPHAQKIVKQQDGGMFVSFPFPVYPGVVAKKLLTTLEEEAGLYMETKPSRYAIDEALRDTIKPFFLAFQGCIALLLVNDFTLAVYKKEWSFSNTQTGEVYIGIYSLRLYKEFSKIVNPITPETYDTRTLLEQTITGHIRSLCKRIQQAQPEYEGIAMLSYVEEKTMLQQKEINKRIDTRCFDIIYPSKSPFFH